MKVLVTGSEGYIGVLLPPLLLERGHEVVGLDTGYYKDGELYAIPQASYPCLRRDIRHIDEKGLAGYDAVVHLAELSNDPLGDLNPKVTYRINHVGSVDLARNAKAAGIRRFVYTSSCSVYGVGNGEYLTEESPTNPQTPYARCKILVERDVSRLADEDFSPTFLRNATAYGPSPRMRFDIVLNNLAGVAWTTGEIRLTSDGTPWRPLVHVRDITKAIVHVLEAPREVVHNQTLNVGDTGQNHRVREIAEIVSEAIPGCRLSVGRSDGDNRSYRVSFEKINRKLPGFRCDYDAVTGARELAELFDEIGLTQEEFRSPAFTRLKQLQGLIADGRLDAELFWRDGEGRQVTGEGKAKAAGQ